MLKILVTGSLGTLGTPLVTELKYRNYDVYGLDLRHCEKFKYSRTDIVDYRQLTRVFETNGFDFVYHLAAEFGRINGEQYYENVWKTNVIGTRNILELQKIFGFKLVFASSSEIYGDIKVDYLTEEMNPLPQKK